MVRTLSAPMHSWGHSLHSDVLRAPPARLVAELQAKKGEKVGDPPRKKHKGSRKKPSGNGKRLRWPGFEPVRLADTRPFTIYMEEKVGADYCQSRNGRGRILLTRDIDLLGFLIIRHQAWVLPALILPSN
jgi:hypothetical protein